MSTHQQTELRSSHCTKSSRTQFKIWTSSETCWEIDPAFGRAANIKPDILDGQPNNKLNFSRRLAPSPPAPPKSNVDVITRIRFFLSVCVEQRTSNIAGGRRPTTTTKTEVKFVGGMIFFLDNIWSWRCVILSSAWVWAKFLTIRLEARSALNKIVKFTQAWMSWTSDVNTPRNSSQLMCFCRDR